MSVEIEIYDPEKYKHQRDAKGRVNLGNSLWKVRSSAGRHPKFESAEVLAKHCSEYFQWCEDNPLYEAKLVTYEGESSIEYIPRKRPFLLEGLCIFLDINASTWRMWRREKPEFLSVMEDVEQTLREQKLHGAMAGFFNPNITARLLGLVEKTETKVEGAVTNVNVQIDDPLEASKVYQQLMRDSEADE